MKLKNKGKLYTFLSSCTHFGTCARSCAVCTYNNETLRFHVYVCVCVGVCVRVCFTRTEPVNSHFAPIKWNMCTWTMQFVHKRSPATKWFPPNGSKSVSAALCCCNCVMKIAGVEITRFGEAMQCIWCDLISRDARLMNHNTRNNRTHC